MITVDKVSKNFGELTVLQDVSFVVEKKGMSYVDIIAIKKISSLRKKRNSRNIW